MWQHRWSLSEWCYEIIQTEKDKYCCSHLCVRVLVTRLCLTLCNPMDCSPPGSSVHVIFQARMLECSAISSSRGSSWPRDQTLVSCIAGRFFTIWATRVALTYMWSLKELNSEVESIMVVLEAEGKMRCWWKGTKF